MALKCVRAAAAAVVLLGSAAQAQPSESGADAASSLQSQAEPDKLGAEARARQNSSSSVPQYRLRGSSGAPASQSFAGRLLWKGSSKCMQLGRKDHYNLYLNDCNGDDLWTNDACGHIVNQLFTYDWREYWDGPAMGDYPNHENGQIYSLPYPGMSVPCDRGLKLTLEPFPVVDMTSFPDPNSGGCYSKPSGPFQIKSGSNCVTIKDQGSYDYDGNHIVLHMAVLAPCVRGDINQEFTYVYRGCD